MVKKPKERALDLGHALLVQTTQSLIFTGYQDLAKKASYPHRHKSTIITDVS